MRSSPTITLFSDRPEPRRQPYSFLVSILVHVAVIGLIYLGLMSAPQVKPPALAQHYDVRHIDLHTLRSQMQRAANSGFEYPRLPSARRKLAPGGSASERPPLRQAVQAPLGPQTLLQPDIPKPLVLNQEIPLPTAVIWDGMKTSAKNLVPPQQQKPAVSNVAPSVQLPNQEQKMDIIALAPTDHKTETQNIVPSNTSPVVVRGPEPTPPTPITNAKGSEQPTPASVMSVSDLQMADGEVALPPVNESASSSSTGLPSAGQTQNSTQGGQLNPAAGQPGETGAGQGSTGTGETAESGPGAQGEENAAGQSAFPQGGSKRGNPPPSTHISLPTDGQFGAVVVGSTLEEKYPETAPLWSGRVSYTVYLHVGLAKSWILQYSLSRADNAAAAGNIIHIEAPWPYNIVRPNIPPGAIDADALMVHGFVNQDGRFEALSVLFPPEFTQAQFVLNALAQWQFRPATQNGQNVKVEVLLIIPEETQ